MTTYEVVKIIITRLKESGFRLLYYSSMTSESHYFKIDGGVSNSIRVSDHHSHKHHLVYKYNVITDEVGHRWWMSKGTRRNVYGPDSIDLMIKHIIAAKRLKTIQFGDPRYKQLVEDAFIKCKYHKKLHRFKEI